MRYSYLWMALLIFFIGCGQEDPLPPSRIEKVGSAAFGNTYSGTGQEMLVLEESILTGSDSLELFFTPQSRRVWRIDLIIPEFPGGGKPCQLAAAFVRKRFSIVLNSDYSAELPGTYIKVSPAYDRGPAGVRISFTDLEYQKLFEKENSSAPAKQQTAKKKLEQKIMLLENAVISFYEDTGKYPENTDQLLRDPGFVRWLGPYIDEIPCADDGKPLLYRRKGESFEIRAVPR